jgi:hypothetical protein
MPRTVANSIVILGDILMFDLKSKQGKLFTAIVTEGKSMTAAQITKKFSIKNPSAAISDIRYAGYPVYTNVSVAKNGKRVTEYRHGKASRKLIAAGYMAMAAGIVEDEQR